MASSQRTAMAKVEIKVRNKLLLDTDARVAPMSLATHLAEVIRQEVLATAFPIKEQTRRRRTRSLRTPQQGRYPSGHRPDPQGPYGRDSGYLMANIKAALDAGNRAFVGIPKNRQKAAFVLRRISKNAARPEAKVMRRGLQAALRAMVGTNASAMRRRKQRILRGER